MICHSRRFCLTSFRKAHTFCEALIRVCQVRYYWLMSLLQKPQIVIAFYLESEWDNWRSMMADGPDFFADSFRVWETRCSEMREEKTRQGYNVYVVPITVTEFVQWAKLNDRTTDAQARAEYAGLNLGQMYFN